MNREQEIIDEIARIGDKHARAYQKEIEPLKKELMEINNCKVPRPIITTDGELIQYFPPQD